jgi:hypothetical protein
MIDFNTSVEDSIFSCKIMLDHTSEEKQGWVQVGGMREVAIFNECRKSCLLCKDIYEIAEKTLQ